MALPNRILGIGAVVLAAFLWGTTGTLQTFLPDGREPLAVGTLRLLIGAVSLLALASIRPETRRAFTTLPLAPIVGAGAAIGLYNLVFFWAVTEAGVGIGTAITIGSAPVWATLFEGAFLRRWPTGLRVAGQAVSIAGVVLLALAGSGGGTSALGVLLAATAGASYAAYSLLTSAVGPRAPSATVAAATFSVAALMTLPVLFLVPLGWLWHPQSLVAMLFLGVGATGVAYALYTWGLKHVAASTAVTLALTEPVTAWVLATVVVGEPLSTQKVLGAVLVLVGLTVVTVFATRRQG